MNLAALSRFLFSTILLSLHFCVFANSQSINNSGREIVNLDNDWTWYYAYDVSPNVIKNKTNLPHTWNAEETMAGKMNYRREAVVYEKSMFFKENSANNRYFLYFQGVNSVAQVFVNGQLIGEHKGGYTAFCLEATAYLKLGSENQIKVLASNAYRTDVLPLSGDFNVYGGIHRSVNLIVTGQNCITPIDYASSGVYLTQKNVNGTLAEIDILTKFSIKSLSKSLSVRTIITNASGNTVSTQITGLQAKSSTSVTQKFSLKNPVLWDGTKNPYLYKVTVELLQNQKVVDRVIQPLGLRYYKIDADKGFFLNGKYLDLYGFGKHEDVKGRGSAVTKKDNREDFELLKEIGANSLRLTHYPHGQDVYNLSDTSGIILWTEIPLVGPGGYTGPGYIKSEPLHKHAKQILTELIRQNYNHPSIIFWGLFNELKFDYDDPIPFLKELNALVKKEDPYRITTSATFIDSDVFNSVSDVIAWNKYYGWYEGTFKDMGKWADHMHRSFPDKPIAISEYGAGGSPFQHSSKPNKPRPGGKFHPEEWQVLFHESNWEELAKRPFIWGKYIWAFSDFGSSIRNEGDTTGINDKGLITYDRKIKKDAFYFYKANWTSDPMLHITAKRDVNRTESEIDVKAYTNLVSAELFVNGKSSGVKEKDALHRVVWGNVKLEKGKNNIELKSMYNDIELIDKCIWELQ